MSHTIGCICKTASRVTFQIDCHRFIDLKLKNNVWFHTYLQRNMNNSVTDIFLTMQILGTCININMNCLRNYVESTYIRTYIRT